MPGRKKRPDVPTNVTVTLVGDEAAVVKRGKTPRAEYHRVWVKVDEEAVPVGSPSEFAFYVGSVAAKCVGGGRGIGGEQWWGKREECVGCFLDAATEGGIGK